MSLIVGKTALNALRPMLVADDGSIDVNVHGGAVGSGDMKARSDIADPATSTFIKCNPDGTLEMTAELDSSNLAKEETLVHVFNKVALTADRTFAIMNRQLGTSGEEVQHTKVMGSEDGATTGIQHQLAVDSAGHLQVDILSGGGTSDATAANQLVSQGKLDNIISNTASLGDTAGRTLLTAQNQTNGNQITKCMGLSGTSQVQLKVDANGVLETSGGGGGGGDASADNQTNGNQRTKVLGNFLGNNVILKCASDGTLYVNNGYDKSHLVKADINTTLVAGAVEAYLGYSNSMFSYSRAVIYGNTTNKTDKIYVNYGSSSSGTFYKDWENPINIDPITGDFFMKLTDLCVPYYRLSKENSTGANETIIIKQSVSQGN